MADDWHSIAIEEIAERLKVDLFKGLDQQEAEKRLRIYGFNELPVKKRRSIITLVVNQMKHISRIQSRKRYGKTS